jgi:Holliday junction resolvase RusA-like endonuclease
MGDVVEFNVIGVPVPKGSMRAFKDRGGNVRTTHSGGERWATWNRDVASAAKDAAAVHGKFTGTVRLDVQFRFPVPASWSKKRRAIGSRLMEAAPDLDKLVRAVGDAVVAAGLLVDDRLIAQLWASKVRVDDWTGAWIRIQEVS